MPRRIEIELFEPSNVYRKIADLIPQDDGTERAELLTQWGPLVIVLGEPVAADPIAEPAAQVAEPAVEPVAAPSAPASVPAPVSTKAASKKAAAKRR